MMARTHYSNWNELSFDEMLAIEDLSRLNDYLSWQGDSFGLTIDYRGYFYDVIRGEYHQYWDGGMSDD